ncbi:hypothetical protein MAPG_11861 [Magnaporthiopsis poae ATCC 64411]|uniref:N-acetyltransferase ESCO zinc-finger domain-containing protein n=1 Tax=Magnaporthiopsis poae (strain ATCC 64411 / 73-15) TaxID=644358 RepID=A0A0C4EGC7_MAGP6|nr:hypothetical protein MAPG_11861 [Magnaporthiopsis poae ATCC 64411]
MPLSSLASDPANTLRPDTAPARRRPLVTYGKRKPTPRETTPPPKKRRLETPAERDPSLVDGTCIVATTSPTSPPPPTSPPKASILRYFKKVTSPTSASERSFTAASASQTPDSTPSASPSKTATPESRPRSRRRLTTRPFAGLDAVSAHENERSRDGRAPGPAGRTTDPSGEPSPRSTAPDSSALRDTSANKTKSTCNCSDKLCRHTRRTRSKRAGHRSPTATVQMTLNLSTRDASIKQCRECDMLYNPLHPSDVKHHARHHASVVKMKAAAG